jgi:hypothetical protein
MHSLRVLALTAVFGFVGLSVGFTASLGYASRSLGTARVTTPRCTSAALGVINNLSGANVTSVTVSGLPAACGGAAIQVAFNNGATSSTGSGAVPAGGGSVTVSLAAPIADTVTAQTDVLLTGP